MSAIHLTYLFLWIVLAITIHLRYGRRLRAALGLGAFTHAVTVLIASLALAGALIGAVQAMGVLAAAMAQEGRPLPALGGLVFFVTALGFGMFFHKVMGAWLYAELGRRPALYPTALVLLAMLFAGMVLDLVLTLQAMA